MSRSAVTAALVLAAVPCLAQVPAGPEFRVNVQTVNNQSEPDAAIQPGGGFVVTWSSRYLPSYQVYGRRFDSTGVPLGPEFRVTPNTVPHRRSHVRADARGDFVVVWQGSRTIGRRFDPAGVPLGSEFVLDDQLPFPGNPTDMAMHPDGHFVVVWNAFGGPGDADIGIFARRVSAAGVPLGDVFLVNTYTTGNQQVPDVAMDDAGNFVVAWYGQQAGSGYDVFAQRFDANGQRLGSEFRVNTYTTGTQWVLSVASEPSGRFVVAWTGDNQDGSGRGVFGQRFESSGAPIGGEFAVNSYTTGDQAAPVVAVAAAGEFVVGWNGVDTYGIGAFAQRFTATGARRGAEFRINTYLPFDQFGSGVFSDDVGNLLALVTSDRQDGSGYGVYGRRYGGLRPTALRIDTGRNQVFEPGETVDMRPSWRNVNGSAQVIQGRAITTGGPAGGQLLVLGNQAADYLTIPDGAVAECDVCYGLFVPDLSPRPAPHWDGIITETLLPDAQGQQKPWTIHIGASFADVPPANIFYRFVETVFHNDVMGGCGGGQFCPTVPVPRDHMATFVLQAKDLRYVPPDCVPGQEMFADVPASSGYCRWIEELARRGVVTGCGGGNYCPNLSVTRESLAVYVLKTLEGSAYAPPPCGTPIFNDVPASSGFCPWVEELYRRGVVTGCGGGSYCPTLAVARDQMSVFLTVTFGLALYGP